MILLTYRIDFEQKMDRVILTTRYERVSQQGETGKPFHQTTKEVFYSMNVDDLKYYKTWDEKFRRIYEDEKRYAKQNVDDFNNRASIIDFYTMPK